MRKSMSNIPSLSPGFVIAFLLFSGLFFVNSYKLWFRTDSYYEDIYASLTRQPSLYPFREFFLQRMQNKKRWALEQKIFSAIGLGAIIGADILVIAAWMNGR